MNVLALILLLFNVNQLHNAGYRGEGMKIAVIDGGFFRANDPAIFPQEQILGTYDLVKGSPLTTDTLGMFEDPTNNHGTMVLSTMLYQDSAFTGTAPKASYYLIRSEDKYTEYYGEVERLAQAFMLADSLDADIITVSLGYTRFDPAPGDSVNPLDFTYADMNGSSVAAQAATRLARNGRLVLVSAGNDGNKDWHYISTPADADSIPTVGAVDANGDATYFTSYGPSADGRMKPEVSALGADATVYHPEITDTLGNYIGGIATGNGTSFSCPEVAGMAACLWQALPDLTAMQLRDLIMQTASLYPSYDDQRGYGVPDAWAAYCRYQSALCTTPATPDGQHKRIENGQVVIIRNGVKYSVLGLLLR